MCKFALSLGDAMEKVSILPYHKYAETKYTAIGREYPYKGIDLLTDERVEELRQLVESNGLKVDVGK